MRTKTLLIAAAALAAGVISSQAQAVYSQNVVGYVNVPTTAGLTYCITVPFAIGVSNGANEVWPITAGVPSLPDSSQVLIWTGNNYTTYYSDSTSPSGWDDINYNYLPGAPTLPVGKGFFLTPFNSTTNTFVGAVALNVGTTYTNKYTAGLTYLVSPVVPYGGAITNGTGTTGGVALSSLNGLPDSSQLLIWTGNNYTTYYSDSTSPSLWDDINYNYLATPLSVSVGQGFFITPFDNFSWSVGL